ncbi:hypothetical protein M758_7G001700 [Ceratodon purpureus]|uniref:Uncharacterized protein n=1 Tax=Ceratodon purpureus TaxID=3225 RepID=A0A8T0H347_CERPU|nr:hypothetical protein KC19_7G001900 [Ceratodon purpureus]KAG0609625.1 hypothetical protein M758_7G001700 [Ceratodon purpureus]
MSSSTTLQDSSPERSSSSIGSTEPGGSVLRPRQAAPPPARNILSNRNVSEITRCQVTGFVNFVEAQPSVGRFKSDDQEPPPSPSTLLHMTAGSPARIKIANVVAPTIAPVCNYGVFNRGSVNERDPALAPHREVDFWG